MNALDAAYKWIDFGASPIPLGKRSKIPIINWTNWSNQLPSIDLIKVWFKPEQKRNIGLCSGMNNLVVIDFDNMSYYDSWHDHLSKLWKRVLSSTYSVKTSRGIHFYLRTREQEQNRKLKEGVDIKAWRSIVVAAPSVHPSGVVYTDNDHKIITVDNTTCLFPYPVLPDACKPSERDLGEWECKDEHQELLSIKDIKSKISIIDVVSGYTRLHRTSTNGRWWMGRCPAITHNDTHPSFRVDIKQNKCTCLSSGCILFNEKGNDIFDFYQRMNGVDLKSSIEDLSKYC